MTTFGERVAVQPRRAGAILAIAAFATFGARTARADDLKQVCSAAYQEAQSARKAGRLRAASENALVCAQSGCPDFVKVDCAAWLTEIDASLPTVVFDARDTAGKETTEVRISIDGAILRERLDGKGVAFDPGEHAFRYELQGAPSIEERVLIREAEKNRRISISFTRPVAPAPPAPIVDRSERTTGGAPTAAYVLAGTGVVAFGLFATFGILGRTERSDLEDTCHTACNPKLVSPIRAKLIAADVSLGVGVITAGIATYLFISAPPKTHAPSSASSLELRLAPTIGGAVGGLRGSF